MLPYRHKIEGCLADQVGEAGLTPAELADAVQAVWPGVEKLRAQHADASLPILRLPATTDDIPDLVNTVEELAAIADTLIVLGTGGSSLGGQTLCQIPGRSRRRVVFYDNIDPDFLEREIDGLVPASTAVLVVSKSGATAETVALYRAFWPVFRKALGEAEAARRFRFVVRPGSNALRRLAEAAGIDVLDHDPLIGGRYSVLSLVGMLPALFHGLEPRAIRAGAAAVMSRLLTARSADDIEPAVGAGIAAALMRDRGVAASVVLPYSDQLEGFSRWYAQLWAESLGKKGKGSLPFAARGTVDQHSQLQLWLDGPQNTMISMVMVDWHGRGAVLADDVLDPDLAYLTGKTMGDLIDAEQRATAATLVRAGRPLRVIEIDAVREETLGALLMHFMIETILCGYVLGVNPFDQPAVEYGKQLTRKFLSAN